MRVLVYLTLVVAVVGLLTLHPSKALCEDLTIAAASDLNFAFKELVSDFEKRTGTHVKLSLGSSGNLFSQIQNGAPFDLYLSADIRFPQRLAKTGHAVAGSLYQYAVGRIVVWVPRRSLLPVEKLGMEVLLDPSIRKIAIANPKHAPYGRAAVAAMQHAKIYDRVKDKLVLGENISQAAQFVESGAADIGIIALSLAIATTMKEAGRYWEVPLNAYPSLEQGAILLKSGKNPEGARAFLVFLQGTEGQTIMHKYGFILPADTRRP